MATKTIDDKIAKAQAELAALRKQKRMQEAKAMREATLALGELVATMFGAPSADNRRQLTEVFATSSPADLLAHLATAETAPVDAEGAEGAQSPEAHLDGEAEAPAEAPPEDSSQTWQ